VGLLLQFMRDLSEQQSELFLITGGFLMRHQPVELQPLIDDDVAGAATALAATFETAARGVIYEHRPPSGPAERLAAALKPLFVKAGENAGTSFDRDAAVVLRRIEEAVVALRAIEPGNRRPFLEMLGRVTRKSPLLEEQDAPRLIVP
jgi:hypothetical protein